MEINVEFILPSVFQIKDVRLLKSTTKKVCCDQFPTGLVCWGKPEQLIVSSSRKRLAGHASTLLTPPRPDWQMQKVEVLINSGSDRYRAFHTYFTLAVNKTLICYNFSCQCSTFHAKYILILPSLSHIFSCRAADMGDQGDTGNVEEIKETIEKTEEEQASVSNQLSENGSLKDVSKEKSQEDQMMMEIRKVEKMAKEEGAICDPFRVRLSFSLAEKLQMTILGVFLVPIRFISAFLALNLAWAISCVGLVGLDNTQPVSGWRKHLQRVTCFLGRVCCMCMGFQVSKTGTQVCFWFI